MLRKELKEKIETFAEVSIQTGVPILGSIFSEAIIGQFAPGIISGVIAYRQKRFEKNIMKLLQEVNDRATLMEEKLKLFSEEEFLLFKEHIFPDLIDYVIDESQEEKIKVIVNGMQYILENKYLNRDNIITYYDILNELRLSDITILLSLIDDYHGGKVGFGEAEDDALESYIFSKLERLILINTPSSWTKLAGGNYRIEREHVHLSNLGKSFVNFFKEKKL